MCSCRQSPCNSSVDALLLLASLPCIAFYLLRHVKVRMFFIVLRHNMSFFSPFLLLLCFMFELFTFGLFQFNRTIPYGRIWWGRRCAILELREPVHFVFNCKMYHILKRQTAMQWTVSHLTMQVLHFYLWRPAFFSHRERGVTFNSACFNVCIKKSDTQHSSLSVHSYWKCWTQWWGGGGGGGACSMYVWGVCVGGGRGGCLMANLCMLILNMKYTHLGLIWERAL